jgi:hypothetical protein
MIPAQLRELCEKQPGKIHRADRGEAQRALQDLGIPLQSEFAEFYLEYSPINFLSTTSYESLSDVSEPTRQVEIVTEFAHEVWQIPSQFICFTSGEGEGGYLYNILDGSVWDFELSTRQEFLDGKQSPMFSSFFAFLVWYLR